MYEFAYDERVEGSRETMPERAALDRVIGLLRDARQKGPLSRERARALPHLRVRMAKEVDRVRAGGADDLAATIEIDEIVRDGLAWGDA